MDLPVREKLPHAIPQWVADGSWFFITINCVPPGKNQVCRADTGDAVLAAMKFNHERFIWHCRLCLLMPDHVHAIIAFSREPGMATTVKNLEEVRRWKTWRGLATRFLRPPPARSSRTRRENQLHPDESGPQRIVPASRGLVVGISSKRPPAAASVAGSPLHADSDSQDAARTGVTRPIICSAHSPRRASCMTRPTKELRQISSTRRME